MKKKLLSILTVSVMVICTASLAACADTSKVEKVELNKTELTLEVGETETLTVTITPDEAKDEKCTWASTDKAIATVDKDGKVTAVAVGKTKIGVVCGDKSAKCEVTVKAKEEPAEKPEEPITPVQKESKYEIKGEVPTTVNVGEINNVDITLAATEINQLGLEDIIFYISVSDKENISLLATDTNGNQHDVAKIGFWGPPTGFDIPNDYSATTNFKATFAKPGEYTITVKLAKVNDATKVYAEKTFTVNVPNFEIVGESPANVKVNTETAVDFTLKAAQGNELALQGILLYVEVSNKENVDLLATDTTGKEWDVADIGFWGPAAGFDIPADYTAITNFKATFKEAGTYTITIKLAKVADKTVYAEKTLSITVA